MGNLQQSYAGASYAALWDASLADAVKVNGREGDVGKLTNAQLAALVRAWSRCAARSKAPTWAPAYELTIAALGYTAPGDRFVMTEAHMKAPAPAALVEYFWRASRELAQRLDADGTKLERLYVDWSTAGYQQAARDAWQRMQVERGQAATAPAAATKTGSGFGLLALLLAFVLGGKKRGRR